MVPPFFYTPKMVPLPPQNHQEQGIGYPAYLLTVLGGCLRERETEYEKPD